jgi:hypothetical protein
VLNDSREVNYFDKTVFDSGSNKHGLQSSTIDAKFSGLILLQLEWLQLACIENAEISCR